MAGEVGRSSLNLKLELLKKGHAFSFFQVMRLLRLLVSDWERTEEKRVKEGEKIRIRPELSLTFPASDVAKIEEFTDDGPSFLVTATMLGLYGTSSPLPTFYTEDLMNEEAEDLWSPGISSISSTIASTTSFSIVGQNIENSSNWSKKITLKT